MMLTEIHGDLFAVSNDYYLAHCISADYRLGAGIARQFSINYDVRRKLFRKFPHLDDPFSGNHKSYVGKALLIDNIFNLVTKSRYFEKPTYDTLKHTLEDMKQQCDKYGIKRLAMPRIGCGLDRLNWDMVKKIIKEIFTDTDIEIVVYYLSKQEGE